jgi:hypothetical protein
MGRQFESNENETPSSGMGGSCCSANQLSSQAKEVIQNAKARAGEEVKSTLQWVEREGVSAVEAQKERFAGVVDRVVSVIDNAADKMEQEGDDTLGLYVRSLSDKVQRTSQYLHEQDVRKITQDLGSFLRRHSEVAIAATLIAGFALGRFLRASGRSAQYGEGDYEAGESGSFGGFGESMESEAEFPGEQPAMAEGPERTSAGQFSGTGTAAPM